MIDHEIIGVQSKKADVTEELMKPLLRRHDEGPLIQDILLYPPAPPMEFSEFEGIQSA